MLDPLDGQGPLYRRTASKEEERLAAFVALCVVAAGLCALVALFLSVFV
jgi:hypothetical protein